MRKDKAVLQKIYDGFKNFESKYAKSDPVLK